jgi:uncharacterized protein YciI
MSFSLRLPNPFAYRHWLPVASFLAIASLCPLVGAQENSSQSPPKEPLFWVFLTTGKSSQGIERAELEKMQKAHLDNFGRLHGEKKLFLAGPMSDPEKKRRGIVVVTAPDVASLPKLFEPDPFVQNGLLAIDAIPMEMVLGQFHGDIVPESLAEYRLVLLEKGSSEAAEIPPELYAKNLSYCKTLHSPERLCMVGWLSGDQDPRRGILVFRNLDDKVLRSLVDELPAVKSMDWKYTIIPLFMSDGVVH